MKTNIIKDDDKNGKEALKDAQKEGECEIKKSNTGSVIFVSSRKTLKY